MRSTKHDAIHMDPHGAGPVCRLLGVLGLLLSQELLLMEAGGS